MIEEILGKNEETLQKYLEDHNKILMATLGVPEYAYNFVIPKFSFGGKYQSDFLVFTGQSSSYWITLVELEAATRVIFTKNGVYAKYLNIAMRQVKEWKIWINENMECFRKLLYDSIRMQNCDFYDKFHFCRRFIINQVIIIGRRNSLSKEDRDRIAEEENNRIQIITYDRLVECEKRIEQMRLHNFPFDRYHYDTLINDTSVHFDYPMDNVP